MAERGGVVRDGAKISGLPTLDQDREHWKKFRFGGENGEFSFDLQI